MNVQVYSCSLLVGADSFGTKLLKSISEGLTRCIAQTDKIYE